MRCFQGRGDAHLQYFDVGERQRTRLDSIGQRRAVNKLHRQIGASRIGVDRKYEITHDRFVREFVKRLRFTFEQFQDVWIVREFGADHFDRHRIPRLDVEASIDFTHAALRDERNNLVNAVEANA